MPNESVRVYGLCDNVCLLARACAYSLYRSHHMNTYKTSTQEPRKNANQNNHWIDGEVHFTHTIALTLTTSSFADVIKWRVLFTLFALLSLFSKCHFDLALVTSVPTNTHTHTQTTITHIPSTSIIHQSKMFMMGTNHFVFADRTICFPCQPNQTKKKQQTICYITQNWYPNRDALVWWERYIVDGRFSSLFARPF